MKKKLLYAISIILLILLGGGIWHYNNPKTIASSSDGCFRFFGLSTPSKDHCVDYLYSQGREWNDFGSKIYYLNHFSKDELSSIEDEMITHGATRSDAVITLTAHRGNIDGKFQLLKQPSHYQIIVYYQEV